jgi:hypothetical protein
MPATLIQRSPAFELSLSIETGLHGHHLSFLTLVPIARQPEPRVRFQATLSTEELAELHAAIGRALARQPVLAVSSPLEPVRH